MKTTKINKAYVVFTLFFFMMSWQLIKAQAVQTPYFVNNVNAGCAATVDLDFYDGGSTPCASFTGQSIAGGASSNFSPGGSCGTLTDVVVTVTHVGMTPFTSNNKVNISFTWDTHGPISCAMTLVDIAWTSSATDIYFH